MTKRERFLAFAWGYEAPSDGVREAIAAALA